MNGLLQDAVIRGDVDTVRRLVFDGVDVEGGVIALLILGARSLEGVDAAHVTASAPGRLAILSFLLDQSKFSLYSLNAPQEVLSGLTPLCMAAYLGRQNFVSTLLERRDGFVLVDGVDAHRATPIMYATRDGHSDIVQFLLDHGARPDSIDYNHRSVLFYSASSPHCLWKCEKSLRQRRAEALLSSRKKQKLKLSLLLSVNQYNTLASLYQSPSVLTLSEQHISQSLKLLSTAITSSDFATVHSLLFPTPDNYITSSRGPSSGTYRPVTSIHCAPSTLVNLPDVLGWAAIHYCVTAPQPNRKILDTLYLAGADIRLYTSDNRGSPLHCLARAAIHEHATSFQLYSFVVHLVKDLGAPLDACDLEGNTCIHTAAEHGCNINVLMAFLDCDTSGSVRKMRNDLGLTAFEVAKEDFRIAFDAEDGPARPSSASSMRTIRPSMSSSSLASSYSSSSTASSSSSSSSEDLEIHEQFPSPRLHVKENLRASLFSSTEADQLLSRIRQLSEDLETTVAQENSIYEHGCQEIEIDDLEIYLHDTWQNGSDILERFRQLVDMAVDDLRAAKDEHFELDQVLSKLEVRMRDMSEKAEDVERRQNANSRTTAFSPRISLQSFYSGSTPTLAESASSSLSSSFASLASLSLTDVDELVTPPGSPRSKIAKELDLDLASALSSGKRRGTSPSLLTKSSMEFYEPPSSPSSPLEIGVNLISVPPSSASIFNGAEHGVSWLDPFVRKANSETFQAHLANLIEIQKTLFGEDDEDDEDDIIEEGQRWENYPEILSNGQRRDRSSTTKNNSITENNEDGSAYAQGANFLDLFTTRESTGEHAVDVFSQATSVSYHTLPMSPAGILEMAKCEAFSLEENIREVERAIDSAQVYLSQAERLTSRIFQAKEHTVQAVRLSQALRCISEDEKDIFYRPDRCTTPDQHYISLTPTSSPAVHRTGSMRRLIHNSPTELSRQSSLQSLVSPVTPAIVSVKEDDDVRTLRRLLVRKIPARLEGAFDEVDRAGIWVGVLQEVMRNLRRKV